MLWLVCTGLLDLYHERRSISKVILSRHSVAVTVLVLCRVWSWKEGSTIKPSQQCLKTALARSHWQLMESRTAAKMLRFTLGFDLKYSQSHGLGSSGRVYLPWLRSGLFLCSLSAAESLAPWVYAGYGETLVFWVLVRVACTLLVAGAAMNICISWSWQARSW